ncbi:hypothetical protein CSOJ01_10785 [Colletotrichum sojae]|uniref:BTB domain-containing protein n=1 Tax=Colletotrichum sojae TaxID=2175907 RepID=A0A8H6MNS2_9PEZI|nr:hypothetical protein CSOJ01_10785 [Colletotrichum sojae]
MDADSYYIDLAMDGDDTAPNRPERVDAASSMPKDTARSRLPIPGIEKNDFVITNAVFDFKVAPMHMEGTHVGAHDWFASWFPYNPQHITITDGHNFRFSIPEAILVDNFYPFARLSWSGRWKEAADRQVVFQHSSDVVAIGTIIVFLMFGTFPEHPDYNVQRPHKIIDDLIGAYYLSGVLAVNRMNHVNRAVCLRLRQLLLANRHALQGYHLDELHNLTNEHRHGINYYGELWDVFAQAAVKPWMHSWMENSAGSSFPTFEHSSALDACEQCGMKPTSWADVVSHYLSLTLHNAPYALSVMGQTGFANKLVARGGKNEGIDKLPQTIDHVTYRDPLSGPKVKAHIFTI